jgi:hypothetical protein
MTPPLHLTGSTRKSAKRIKSTRKTRADGYRGLKRTQRTVLKSTKRSRPVIASAVRRSLVDVVQGSRSENQHLERGLSWLDGCHLCCRNARHFRLARQGGYERCAIRFHQHQSGTPCVLVQAPRQFCEPFSRKYSCRTRSARKPNAEAFSFVVEAIGVPAERILFFDDVVANIEGARARGLQPVHVTTRSNVPEIFARMAL